MEGPSSSKWFGKKNKRNKPKIQTVVTLDDSTHNDEDDGLSSSLEQPIGNTIPSAPLLPHDEVVPTNETSGLLSPPSVHDSKKLRSLYVWVTMHLTALSTFTALLVFVPHLRQILRKDIFDKVLLTSIIGGPLIIFILIFAFFPSMRKRFAVLALSIISLTMAWLLSYVITREDAKAMMVSIGSSDACALSTVGLSFIPQLSMTSRPFIAFPPIFMLTTTSIYHGLCKSSFPAVVPSLVLTGLMTHFAFNAREIVKNEAINSSDSGSYGLVQMYMKLSAWRSLKSFVKSRPAYQEIR